MLSNTAEDHHLERVEEERDLGVLFSHSLKFGDHINNNNNNNVLLNQDNYTIISYMGKGPRLRGTKQEPWQGIH